MAPTLGSWAQMNRDLLEATFHVPKGTEKGTAVNELHPPHRCTPLRSRMHKGQMGPRGLATLDSPEAASKRSEARRIGGVKLKGTVDAASMTGTNSSQEDGSRAQGLSDGSFLIYVMWVLNKHQRTPSFWTRLLPWAQTDKTENQNRVVQAKEAPH